MNAYKNFKSIKTDLEYEFQDLKDRMAKNEQATGIITQTVNIMLVQSIEELKMQHNEIR